MSETKATVIVPTTGDRGPLLPYSVGSILNQTVKDIEIFIIGDGVDNQTRGIIYKLIEKDNRIRFFDHPKDISRGEIYRHKALQEASGKIVCYLLDRDLMLPFHIENILDYSGKYNYITSLVYRIQGFYALISKSKYMGEQNDEFKATIKSLAKINNLQYDPNNLSDNSYIDKKIPFVFLLSCMSHTLELYKSLPYGWRTTPPCYYTDQYMQLQLLSHKFCKPYFSITPPSILYFKRGNHPGWPVEKRLKLLKYWYGLIQNGYHQDKINHLVLRGNILEFGKNIKRRNFERLSNIKKRFYEIYK